MLKDVERLTLIFHCNGPIGGITVDADAQGNVRGYVNNPQVDLPLNGKNKFDVSGIVGGGMLYVIREGGYYELGVYQDAYRGSVPIVSGEIAEDIAYYLTKSEQIPSAVSLCQMETAGIESRGPVDSWFKFSPGPAMKS
jgi:molecular chaperone Hsp33